MIVERGARVLVVSDKTEYRARIAAALADNEFEVMEATDATTARALAIAMMPAAVIVDARCTQSARAIVRGLRQDFRSAFVPIVHIVEDQPDEGVVAGLFAGGDDFVTRPEELVARVTITLQRSAAMRGLNPLTGLPGNTVIAEEIGRRLASGDRFAFLYIDLDDFKAYNDRYGFSRGDDVIRVLARCVVAALEAQMPADCFAGHVGGDDFVALTPINVSKDVAKAVIDRFTEDVKAMYGEQERAQGYIEVTDRRGRSRRAPLCAVSIGVVHSDRTFETAAEIAEVAAEVKGIAKRTPGPSWAHDRRRGDPPPA